MSLSGAYDPDNVFAKIIAGQIPAARIYEDAEVLAFMDAFPQTRGHALVVSKISRARNILEIEPANLSQVMLAAQRVALAIDKALQPDGLVIKQFNGSPAGQTVFHLHVHIIPIWQNEPSVDHATQAVSADVLATLAQQISAALV